MKTVLTHRYLCLELVRNQPGGFGAKYFGGFKKRSSGALLAYNKVSCFGIDSRQYTLSHRCRETSRFSAKQNCFLSVIWLELSVK